MVDTEDWRRQRAEELRLHDSGPWRALSARDRQPTADGVELMRPPVASTNELPVRDDPPQADVNMRHRAEPGGIHYRPGRPFAPATAAVAGAGTPQIAAYMFAQRGPGMSMAVRHPLVFGAAVGGVLTAAGALGWLLHAKIDPVPMPATAVLRPAPPVAFGHPLSRSPALPKTPEPTAMVASETARSVGASALAVPKAGILPRASGLATAAKPLPATEKFAGKAKRAPASPAIRDKTGSTDRTSRFAYPAKAVTLPGRNFGPSFNCRRAIAAVNRAICANAALSALDRQMSQTFYSATAHAELERHKAIDRDQVDFLNQRASCNSDECVARVYRQRLAALRQAGD